VLRSLFGAIALLAVSGCGHQSAAGVKLTLRWSSQQLHEAENLFDDTSILLIFANTSTTQVATICACTADTVWFELRRNGVAQKPLSAPQHFVDDPRAFWSRQLAALNPGDTKEFATTGPNFVNVAVSGRYDPTLRYFEPKPGDYVLRAHYLYRGPDFGKPHVVRR
jgi:hypothetical protein